MIHSDNFTAAPHSDAGRLISANPTSPKEEALERGLSELQAPWISRAATLLDDPIMMKWAVHYYNDLPPNSALRVKLENLWFHDVTIQRWIDSDDHDVQGLMFLYLPEQRFSMFAPAIASHWGGWSSGVTESAARVLVKVAPNLAAEAFKNYLKNQQPWDVEKVTTILNQLNQLAPAHALPLLEKLLPLAWESDKFYVNIICNYAFKPAVQLKPQVLPRLLDGLFAENGDRLGGAAESVCYYLFGHDAYARLYFIRREDYDIAEFSDLAPLFDAAAPLAEMDGIVRSENPLPDAMLLLEKHHARSPEASLAWETIQHSNAFREKKHPIELAALALAGVAAAFERKTVDAARLPIGDVIALLALDVVTNIHYDALLYRLRSFSKAEILAAMAGHIEKIEDSFGGMTIARLMGDLAWTEFTRALIGCMDGNVGDYLCEAAKKSLLNIGEPARDALLAQWDELDFSQKIYGASVIAGVGGTAVADFAVNRFAELCAEDVERWCDYARAAPDPRMIALLRPELRRQQPLIDEIYYRLCRLLDAESEDIADVRERIAQHRSRQEKSLQNFLKGDLVSDRHTLRLALRCSACGESNYYDVGGVVVDDDGKNPVVADEFPCLSCTAVADFELEESSYMAIAAEALRVQIVHDQGENVTPLIGIQSVATADGKALPLSVAYADLREKVRENPQDWLSNFRLGNILLEIKRPRAAVACYQTAYASNPLLLELIINLAAALIRLGDKNAAFALLRESLAKQNDWQVLSSSPSDRGREFAYQFNQLRRDLGRVEIPALLTNFFGSAPKTGRNDPCPCGSGKKFKKCCMK